MSSQLSATPSVSLSPFTITALGALWYPFPIISTFFDEPSDLCERAGEAALDLLFDFSVIESPAKLFERLERSEGACHAVGVLVPDEVDCTAVHCFSLCVTASTFLSKKAASIDLHDMSLFRSAVRMRRILSVNSDGESVVIGRQMTSSSVCETSVSDGLTYGHL